VSVRDLVRTALRMRPDRLIVGEVRGGEAFDLLQALNTGHDGSLSTVHANSAPDALTRIETLALLGGVALPHAAVRAQVGASVDAVVHVARLRDGTRRVEAIAEVDAGTGTASTLMARQGEAFVPSGAPSRPARRPDVDPPDPWWFSCGP
jgi:pilus assembly protein CpaF